jgi:hypothetical protein
LVTLPAGVNSIFSDSSKVAEIVTENSGSLSRGYQLINIRLSVPRNEKSDRSNSLGVFKIRAEADQSIAETLVVLRRLP